MIEAQERHLSVAYWRLGRALLLARKHFGHGQWERYLKSLGIEKTRAFRAMAIAKGYDTEQMVAALNIEQAFQQRPRKARREAAAKRADRRESQSLKKFLVNVCT